MNWRNGFRRVEKDDDDDDDENDHDREGVLNAGLAKLQSAVSTKVEKTVTRVQTIYGYIRLDILDISAIALLIPKETHREGRGRVTARPKFFGGAPFESTADSEGEVRSKEFDEN